MFKNRFALYIILVIGLASCSTTSAPSTPAGEVKISYFGVTEGRVSKQVLNSYVGLISQQWAKRYGRRLKEPFERISIPAIKVVPDKQMNELMTLIQNQRFYSLKASSLNQVNDEMVQDKTVRVKVITVEINGLSRSVMIDQITEERDLLSAINIKQIIFRTFNQVDDPGIKIELGDWRDSLKPPANEEPPDKPK